MPLAGMDHSHGKVPLVDDLQARKNKNTADATELLGAIERPPNAILEHQIAKTPNPLSIHVLALLIPASTFGTLTRLGLHALATYDGNSIFPLAYAQALGCLVMGFTLGLKEPISRLCADF